MALSGSNFGCDNEDCEYYKHGMVMTVPWPLGNIDEVLEIHTVRRNEEFKEKLLKRKEGGRKYACIQFPDMKGIKIVGWRIQYWCDKCYALREFDVMLENENDTFEEALEKSGISKICFKCKAEMTDYKETVEKGISCPKCSKGLKHGTWYVSEEGTLE